jgi:hypothetical protein
MSEACDAGLSGFRRGSGLLHAQKAVPHGSCVCVCPLVACASARWPILFCARALRTSENAIEGSSEGFPFYDVRDRKRRPRRCNWRMSARTGCDAECEPLTNFGEHLFYRRFAIILSHTNYGHMNVCAPPSNRRRVLLMRGWVNYTAKRCKQPSSSVNREGRSGTNFTVSRTSQRVENSSSHF